MYLRTYICIYLIGAVTPHIMPDSKETASCFPIAKYCFNGTDIVYKQLAYRLQMHELFGRDNHKAANIYRGVTVVMASPQIRPVCRGSLRGFRRAPLFWPLSIVLETI